MQSAALDLRSGSEPGSSRGGTLRFLIWGVGLVVLAVLAFLVYTYIHAPASGGVAVSTVPARTGPIVAAVSGTGQVTSWYETGLTFQAGGHVVSRPVHLGDKVKKGDVVAALDQSQLKLQLEQAQANLTAAQAKLEQIQQGSRPETIAQAQANLTSAQAQLAYLQGGGRPENVAAAQAGLDQAAAHLAALQQGRPESVAQARANLSAAQAKLQSLKNGARPEAVAEAKSNLDAAQAKLAALKAGPTPQQIAVAQQAVEAAKDAAYAADANKDGACNPRNPQYVCDAAQAQADAAHTAIGTAQAQLNALTSPPTVQAIQQAQAAVDQAQQAYELAQKPYTAQDIAQAQAAVTAAQAQLQQSEHPGSASDVAAAQGAIQAAQAQVDLARQPATTADIAKAQAAVDDATQQLKLAQQPYTQADVDGAKAAIAQAQTQVDLAQYNLDNSTLVAPFDGVVSQVNVSEGEYVSAPIGPVTPAISVVDPNDLRLLLNVDENDVSHVAVGQNATVTFNALPGKTYTAKVAELAPSAAVQSSVATYLVELAIDKSAGVLPGMTGNAQIVYAQHDNAVLVPTRAVRTNGTRRFVEVLQGDKVVARDVTTGLTSGTDTEILSGLQPGVQVVVPATVPAFTSAKK